MYVFVVGHDDEVAIHLDRGDGCQSIMGIEKPSYTRVCLRFEHGSSAPISKLMARDARLARCRHTTCGEAPAVLEEAEPSYRAKEMMVCNRP